MHGDIKRAFVPIAGLHHAMRDRAGGFCVFNDCARCGRVPAQEPRPDGASLTSISTRITATACSMASKTIRTRMFADIHEDGRYLYPGTGASRPRPEPAALEGHQAQHSDGAGCRRRRVPDSTHGGASRTTSTTRNRNSSCSSAAPTASKATRLPTCRYTEKAHAEAAAALCRIADEHCEGRIIGTGGGGYNRRNLARAWTRVVQAFVAAH